MNIDQRLEAVTHALEKMAQQQAMMAQQHASHDDNLNRLFELHEKSEERHAKTEEQINRLVAFQAKNETLMAQLVEAVISHERRLSDLEGGPNGNSGDR